MSPTDRAKSLILMGVLLVAFAIGGGGSRYGIANLGVQLAAIAGLAANRESFLRFWGEAPIALRVLIAASLLVPLLQILPLPQDLWSALPGRILVARALDAAGEGGWMPFSVNPARTLLAATALITPLAVLAIGWTLPRERLFDAGWLVVGCGILTALLGLVQLGATDDQGTLFGARSPGAILLGTFANRNSTALFLGFALALAAVLPVPRRNPAIPYLRVGLCALLLIAVILTKSRTGLVLAALPVGLGAAKAISWLIAMRRGTSGQKSRAGVVALALCGLLLTGAAGAVVLVAAPGRVSETLARFEAKDDPRRFIWDDATYSVARYWPAGAGTGTFDEVFQIDESLENLTVRRAGRAHNDYIELAIENGVVGLGLAGLWLLTLVWLSWSAHLSAQRWTAWAGSSLLLAVALQSITDYPLRNQTMLAMAGFALLLLVRSASADGRRAQ
ncbi:MAG: hypothetical protein GC147_04350 [Porphyrobacter sp.]|nr:hypothetical protein [Porphyrobacter sp.]